MASGYERDMVNIVLNEWETAFFGRKIGRVLLKNVPNRPLAAESLNGFALLQAKIKADDSVLLHYLQQNRFQWVEGEIQFSLPLPAQHFPTLEPATEADLAELAVLFGSAFPNSRFRPPYFSLEDNRRFYRQWISNAVQGIFDDVCLVTRRDGHLCGGISLRLLEGRVQIGLLAVAKEWWGKGIGTHLLLGAMGWAKQQGAVRVSVCTQSNNLPAIRLYQRLGAGIDDLHYWLYRNEDSF